MLLKRGKVWHSRIMHDGHIYQCSLKTSDRNLAIKNESIIHAELLKGDFGIFDAKKTPTLAQFETRLVAHWTANVAPRTLGFYKQNFVTLTAYGPLALTRLHKIDEALIEKFIQRRLQDQVSTVTVNHALRTLRRILHIARDWKLIRWVPKVKLLTGENQRDYVLTDDTVNKMVEYGRAEYPKSGFHLLLPFLVDTGLRITEACSLQREHIKFREDGLPVSIRILKGKSKYAKREIPLTERASLTLAACLEQSKCAYAFTGKGGKQPLHRRWPSMQFARVRDGLGIGPECVLHSTRHTFCTRLGNAGADAFTIQKLAGHSSILISQRYVHTDKAAKETAIKLLDTLNQSLIWH